MSLMVKFAIIADIHGNATALNAVLNEIDAIHDIEEIYCLGDMIGIGPDTNKVLHLLFAREDLSMITGNHDEAILALLKGEEHPKSHAHARAHHQWIADRMDKSFIHKLDELPRTIERTIENKSILFTHYHIEKSKIHAHISQDPFSKIVEPSIENLTSLFNEHREDLICFGHHHPLHFFEGHETIFLNPGSLGCSIKSTAPYAIVEIVKGKINIEFKEATYDKRKFLASYNLLQVPERDFLLKIFHGIQ